MVHAPPVGVVVVVVVVLVAEKVCGVLGDDALLHAGRHALQLAVQPAACRAADGPP